jgi:hypothetical protein
VTAGTMPDALQAELVRLLAEMLVADVRDCVSSATPVEAKDTQADGTP